MAPTTKYLVLGEHAAEVDDLRLEPGLEAEAVELNENQIERLTKAGVEVETPQERGKRLKNAEPEAAPAPTTLATAGGDS